MKVPTWLWWLAGGVTAYALLRPKTAGAVTPVPLPGPVITPAGTSEACMPCYDAKSKAYRECMEIPVSDEDNRKARQNCFLMADADFEQCLRTCQATGQLI